MSEALAKSSLQQRIVFVDRFLLLNNILSKGALQLDIIYSRRCSMARSSHPQSELTAGIDHKLDLIASKGQRFEELSDFRE